MIVVDTNVIASIVLPGEAYETALKVAAKDSAWIAPAVWRSELRNVLATTMRVRGLRLADAVTAFESADRLVTDFDLEDSVEGCLAVASQGRASGYDAEFIFAAQRLGRPLVTADRRLARSFPATALSPEDYLQRG